MEITTPELAQEVAELEQRLALLVRKEELEREIARHYRDPDWEWVVEVVADEFGVTAADIHGHRKPVPITEARHLAMSLIYCGNHCTLEHVARFFSCRCHGTILHAIRKVRDRLHTDKQFLEKMERVLERIGKEP